ncbi:hypothetical protein LUZ61_015701 [Rhynchospora tenuis]|uniref:Zinc finger LSD1-type domain-containing protein n=1 Tax=Rhynchospora tenuis TaxID=198213 RepID=A0AAD6EJ10_9POAL|nr:hypothetical protein LUZ61_015701 [Rhynchospora tenuis]
MAGLGSQIVCNGCRSLLIYARGATSVCCAVCNTITPVPRHERIMCGGCRTLLMYNQGASSVRCSCCHTINIVRPVNNPGSAQINCGNCFITLMYPYGAPSVKCAVCHYITNIGPPGPMRPPASTAPGPHDSRLMPTPSTSAPPSQPQNVTVVVENPMTVDEKGKLVSNVVVGVTTGKK